MLFFAQNAWKHITRWNSGGAQGHSNRQTGCVLSYVSFILRFFKKVFFFAQNAWKHITRWDSGGAQGHSNWQPVWVLSYISFIFRFQKCLKAYNTVGFWWCSRALLEEEEEGERGWGRGGEGGGGEGEEKKEKEKEEEGQEAPYNWLTPDHPPLAAFTGI